jgi:glyoxylase-like metal-dependent hydrolase (beta-lactamase superfamily II)
MMALSAVAALAQQPEGPPFTTEIRRLKEGLYVIPGYDGAATGGNTAVRVTNAGVLIVDDRLATSPAEIKAKVRSVTSQPIKYVLSSHHHGDHTGGHPGFIDSAEIVAHENNRANMLRSNLPAPPRVVFADHTAVFLGDVQVQMWYFGRGHTNGDAVTYFPDLKAVHTGDLVVWGKRTDGSQLTPFVDRKYGGSLMDWIGTIQKMLALDFDMAIPGHGPVLTKNDVRVFLSNLITLRQRLVDLARAGTSRADLAAKLKTDDLSWPFPKERLDELWDEFFAGR